MSELTLTDRRSFLLQAAALWQTATVLSAQHIHSVPAAKTIPYQFRFLSTDERTTLRIVMARIAPADEHSGGAEGAHVDEYIDFILSHADSELQAIWHSGLKRYASAIPTKSPAAVDAFLTKQALKEFAPQTEDEIFFMLLKTAVVEGFYTSEEGIKNELGYQGMGFVLDWQGCTHEHHQAPADWQPLLKTRSGGLI